MEGFLLFEDLKRQWKSEFAPDYVLIDSRTGHTDVGGICTRQLADLVTILFTPNEQNLKGLPPIVKAIRKESESLPDRNIELCFVASNVPTLDDEEGILRKLITRFGRAFSDDGSRTRILSVTRYDSLQLLNQDIFTLLRPKSRLAKQYREIFQFIVEQNLDDRLGVLDYLKNRVKSKELRNYEDGNVDRRIEGILRRYQNDAEVLLWIARCYKMRSKPSEAIGLLEKSLNAKKPGSSHLEDEVRIELTETYIANQQLEEAACELKEIAARSTLNTIQIRRLVRLWRLADLTPSPELVACINRSELDFDDIEFLIHDMSETAEWQQVSAELLLRNSLSAIETNEDLLHALLLALIGAQRFDSLPEVSEKLIALDPKNISNLFNVAMASWATNKEPNRSAFENFVNATESCEDREDANYSQCVSLAHSVLGNKKAALTHLQAAYKHNAAVPISKFSCWRYCDASQVEFESDLNEIGSFIESGSPLPLFLRVKHT
jgi:tetratricopeptide (TPR) repeat protein